MLSGHLITAVIEEQIYPQLQVSVGGEGRGGECRESISPLPSSRSRSTLSCRSVCRGRGRGSVGGECFGAGGTNACPRFSGHVQLLGNNVSPGASSLSHLPPPAPLHRPASTTLMPTSASSLSSPCWRWHQK